MQETIPSSLLNVYGQPVQEAAYNGEEVVAANTDGSVMMPTATGPPVGAVTTQPAAGSTLDSVYDAYVLPSPWVRVP